MTLVIAKPLTLAKAFTWNETVWNPSMITTALWLDAADSSTITTVSGAVSQWNDKSGRNYHCTQSTSDIRPTLSLNALNNKSVITFNNSLLDNATGAFGLISRSCFIVAAETTSVNSAGIFVIKPPTGYDYNRPDAVPYETYLSPYNFFVGAGASNSYVLANPGTRPGPVGIYSEIKSPGTGSLYTNGTLVATDSSFNEFDSASTAGYCLGRRFVNSAIANSLYRLIGYIAEIIYCETTVSLSTQQRIEGYLAHKWGLTANLPNNHPYKTVGPTP